jgi:heat-inducible transcriptional repressor
MQGLSPRRAAILTFIIKGYVADATPVASEVVASNLAWKASPATVRHEMAALEEEGYITRPHVSAGGVPTDKGYRFYVQELQQDVAELTAPEQRSMRQRFRWAERDVEAWARLTALILSELLHNLAITTFPRAPQSRLRHLELVFLQEALGLLVLVLQEARLRKELVPLAGPAGREELSQATNKLNAHFAGLSHQEMAAKHVELTPLEAQVLARALHMMQEEEQAQSSEYLVEGLRHLLAQPEFTAVARARDLVEALEERRLLQALLLRSPEVGGLRVVIGGENDDASLKPLSMVVAQYGVSGGMVGTVGIIGPTRMRYDRTVAGVRYLSALMSELMIGVQGTPP